MLPTSGSGVAIGPDSVLKTPGHFSAIRRVAETIALLPLKVYRKTEQGRFEARDHPLFDVLHTQPNEEMSSFMWRESAQMDVMQRGRHYSQIVRSVTGDVRQIWPLDPEKTRADRREGSRALIFRNEQGDSSRVFRRDQVLYLSGPSKNGIEGYDPVDLQSESIGLAIATERYAANYMGNEATPSGVLKHPGRLIDDEARKRLRTSWEQAHGEWGRKGNVALLEEGMEFDTIANKPQESQLLETREFALTDAARFANVPPHLIADLRRTTFSNIESQQLEFVIFTMLACVKRWEQALNTQLLSAAERAEGLFCEFDLKVLMRGDVEKRGAFYQQGILSGFLSPDDVRDLENMNPIPGGAGAEYLRPLNMVPQGLAGAGPAGHPLPWSRRREPCRGAAPTGSHRAGGVVP